jgi:phospholipid-binding lipoprotein MlaA
MPRLFLRRILLVVLVAVLASGCAAGRDPRDPWEPVNRVTYEVNETVDKTIVKPVAIGYRLVVPGPIRVWVFNFFSNLNDVVVLANDLLQFKLVQARDDAARLFINTTWGLLGINDIASLVGLEKHNEDLGQTFGVWGAEPGPYFVIPLLGPSTVRDTAGLVGDAFINPLFDPSDIGTRNVLVALRVVSGRAELLDAEKIIEEAAIDQYAFIRDAYLQRRLNLIHDGQPPGSYDNDENNAAPVGAEPRGMTGNSTLPPGAPAPLGPSALAPSPSPNLNEPGGPAATRMASLQVQRVWLPGRDR